MNGETEPICSQIDNRNILSSHASLLGCAQDDDDDSSAASPRERELDVCAENCKCKICIDAESENESKSVGSIQSEHSRLINT